MTTKSFLFILLFCSGFAASSQIKTLIIDGQSNHEHWPKITYMMKSYLEETGLFTVDVERTKYTWRGNDYLEDYKIAGVQSTEALEKSKPDPDFAPEFEKYDLIVVNFGWDAAPWSNKTQKSFEKFVKNGGGVVIVHSANNSFPDWPEYNEIIGLGGWGDRNEKDGPYVYYDEKGKLQRDMNPGKGGSHGPKYEFVIELRNEDHPITKNMPPLWLHATDELYDRLRGPAKNLQVLATAYSTEEKKGSGLHEPMLMTIDYGKGRIFHTPLGHDDTSWECVGLITSFQRGAEWAATGKVTQTFPPDFPSEGEGSTRKFNK